MSYDPQAIPQACADTPALDVDSILTLHRDGSQYVCFVRKPDPEHPKLDKHGKPVSFENIGSIRIDDLRAMLPAFAEWIAQDGYFSVCSYYRAAPYRNKTTGLPDVWRKEKHLSKLTACYADVDCGRPESDQPGAALEWRQAQYEVGVLADKGVIPQPSIMARSGRGVYVLWLLRDEKDPTKPPHAWPEKVQLYKLCNRALDARLLAHALPADTRAIDAARVLRMPGSIHRKTGRRVEYVIQLDKAGRGFVYTLPELAGFLEIPAPIAELPPATRTLARPAAYRRVKKPGSAPLRSHGSRKMQALRAQDLLTISAWRGGFKKRGESYEDGATSPGRRFILTLYAGFLRGARETRETVEAALIELAASMIPAYPSDAPGDDPPIERIVQDVFESKPRSWRNEKLCSLLGISADGARELDLKTIRPLDVTVEADRARPLRSDLVNERREFARQYLEKYRRVTARALANAYHHAGFIGANPQTANADLNALGFVVNRSAGGRPRKAVKYENTSR